MPVPDGLGGGSRGGGLTPFDRHPAETGLLEEAAGQLDRLAGLALSDHVSATTRAFDPAVQSWDGVAAPELREAGADVAEQAVRACGNVAWGAVPVRYWVTRVDAFNARVEELRATKESLEASQFGATGTGGNPPTLNEIAQARSTALSPLYSAWWTAYNDEILDGAAATARMYSEGPTDETLADARGAGLIGLRPGPAGIFAALWHEQAMYGSAMEAADLAREIVNSGERPTREQLAALNELLAAHAGDPAFAYYLLTALGPENLLALTGDVAVSFGPGPVDTELAGLIGSIQAGLGLSLAVATQRGITRENGDYVARPYELPRSWVDDLIAAGDDVIIVGDERRQPMGLEGFQLLGVLLTSRETADYPPYRTTYAPFDTEFLTRVGGAMLDFEIAKGGAGYWSGLDLGGLSSGMRLNWIGGQSEEQPAGFDPIGGLMFALDHNPEAAVRFFAEPTIDADGDRTSRVDYLLTDREWPDDLLYLREGVTPAGVIYLGSALEGATADTTDSTAARVVHDAVVSVGRDGVTDEHLRRPLGNIAANWIGPLSLGIDLPSGDFTTGLTPNEVQNFLVEVGRDPHAHQEIRVAATVYGALLMDQEFTDGTQLDGADSELRKVALVLRAIDGGSVEEFAAEGQTNRQLVGNVSVALTELGREIPWVGPLVGAGVDVTGLEDAIRDWTDNSEAVHGETIEVQRDSLVLLESLFWAASDSHGGPASPEAAASQHQRDPDQGYGDYADAAAAVAHGYWTPLPGE
jgi:hypothetical protein